MQYIRDAVLVILSLLVEVLVFLKLKLTLVVLPRQSLIEIEESFGNAVIMGLKSGKVYPWWELEVLECPTRVKCRSYYREHLQAG